MAAKVDKVDMSLDDIIKMNRRKQFKNGSVGGRKVNRLNSNKNRTTKPQNQRKPNIVRNNSNFKNNTVRRNQSTPFRTTQIKSTGPWKHDMFEGGKSGRLMIENLHFRVSDNDIKELFKEFGLIKKAAVHYDSAGKSLGNAEITFANKISARKAIEKYNDVLLDGRKMKITLVSDKPAVSINPKPASRGIRKPLAASGRLSQGNRPRNLNRSGGVKRIGGGRPQNRQQTQNRKPKVNPKTREQLDAELDAYVAKN